MVAPLEAEARQLRAVIAAAESPPPSPPEPRDRTAPTPEERERVKARLQGFRAELEAMANERNPTRKARPVYATDAQLVIAYARQVAEGGPLARVAQTRLDHLLARRPDLARLVSESQ